MVNFIASKQLEKNYIVFGGFYKIQWGKKCLTDCRSILEIYNRTYFKNVANQKNHYDNKPDSMFLLMNPGSSIPLDNSHKEPVFNTNNLCNSILENNLVLAKPDNTQYQVMRLMECENWNHARIINLSDIREGKCEEFIKKYKDFEAYEGDMHSIFSKSRAEELRLALDCKNEASIIKGWGVNKKLISLAKSCSCQLSQLNEVGSLKIIGLQHKSSSMLYYHPLPKIKDKQQEWLDSIEAML